MKDVNLLLGHVVNWSSTKMAHFLYAKDAGNAKAQIRNLRSAGTTTSVWIKVLHLGYHFADLVFGAMCTDRCKLLVFSTRETSPIIRLFIVSHLPP
jgi:hypothetical protein